MRVCFISHDAALGGASLALAELVEALQAQGVRCRVVVPGKGPLVRELRRRGSEITWLPCPWWVGTSAAPWERVARTTATLIMAAPFVARLASLRCELVYTNTLTVPVGALAARVIGVPHVWHLHEFGYEDHRLRFDLGLRGAARFMDRFSAAVVAVSEAVAAKFAPLMAPGKVKVVYQAVTVRPDPEAERAAWQERRERGRAFRAVIAGDLSEAKGQADAVRAVVELVQDGIDAELVAVGGEEPRYRPRLEPLVAELGLAERVRLTGRLANPYPVVRTADVALMCSRAEAFGRVTVEAMLAGKPVVGARSGATPELVREGFNGLLYEPGEWRELAERMRFLWEHPEVARRMGEDGRRWAAERFTQERYGRELAGILEAAVEQGLRRRGRRHQPTAPHPPGPPSAKSSPWRR